MTTQSSVKRIGFYFAELALMMLVYAGFIWYFASREYVFSSYNREISWLILLLFGIGIVIIACHLRNLFEEDTQMSLFYEKIERFQTAIYPLLRNKHALPSEKFRRDIRKTVDEHFAVLEPSFIKTRIYQGLKAMENGSAFDHESLSGLLRQKEEIKGTRVRYIAGILIMIGLLGTFLGMVQAIKYLQHFFTASESVDFATLFSDMKQTLGGLDKAFGASIGGITAYLVLGYLNTAFRTKQTHVLHQVEEITVEYLLPMFASVRAETPQDAMSEAVEMLRTLPAQAADQFRKAFEEILQRTIGGSSEHLEATSLSLQQAADGIQRGQSAFAETLEGFGAFLGAFQDGKNQLLSSQETLASGMQEFSQAIGHLKQNQQMLASSLEMTQSYVENSETRLKALDTIVHEIHDMWTENRHAFEDAAQVIRQEHATLAQAVGHLEAFLNTSKTDMLAALEASQHYTKLLTDEHTEAFQKLLEAHTLLTMLVREMKTFVLDEQNGLRLLSTGLDETFGDARLQYARLSEQFDELFKRMQENQ